jgi:hypothetical protein
MLYRNRKTGAEFESPCVCNGEDWDRVEVDSALSQSLQKPEKTAKKPKKGATKK